MRARRAGAGLLPAALASLSILVSSAAPVSSTALAAPPVTGAPPGDAKRGAEVYTRCLACHALEYDRTGPRHCGLIGRRAGSVPGFDYSPAMKKSGIVWDAKTLDRFIAAPTKVVPGTAMGYDGVKDAKERADLIAYLANAHC